MDQVWVDARWRMGSAILLGLALLGAAGSVQAQPPAVHFVYERGPGAERCPGEAEIRERIAELTQAVEFVEDSPNTVQCRFSEQSGRLAARIEFRFGEALASYARTVYSAAGDGSCTELAENASVIIAMALSRPDWPVEPVEEALPAGNSAPDPLPRTRGVAISNEGAEVRTSVARSARAFFFATAAAGASMHTNADLGFSVAVGGGLRRGPHSFALELQLETGDRVTGMSEGFATVATGAIALTGCRHYGPVSGCGLATLGWIRGLGHGLLDATSSTTPHFRVGGRIAAEVNLAERLTCGVHFDLLAALSRTALSIGDEQVWASPRGSASLGFAAAFRFP